MSVWGIGARHRLPIEPFLDALHHVQDAKIVLNAHLWQDNHPNGCQELAIRVDDVPLVVWLYEDAAPNLLLCNSAE